MTKKKLKRMKTIPYLAAVVMLVILSCSGKQASAPADENEAGIFPQSYLLYEDFPSSIVPPRNVEVWLPPNYQQLDALPVLYMFDGGGIFHEKRGWGGQGINRGWQVDEVLDSLNKAGTVPEIIVVGIFNIGNLRFQEYMPAQPKDLIESRMAESEEVRYKDYKDKPIKSDEQLRFIVEELKPFIDATYKTKKDRNNTFIAGSSMGGLISAYAICEYPEVFGGAACFSTHWPPLDGVFLEYIKTNLPDPATHKIYFDHGTEGLDGEYEPFQNIADAAMEARGYEKNVNWMTLKFEGGEHNAISWNARFHIPMEFLFDGK